MLVGKRGSSSTVTMWRAAPCSWARAIDAVSAFIAPGEPSLATRIFANMSGISFGDSRWRGGKRLEGRPEPALGDNRRHHRAGNDRGEQDRILALVDDVVGQ